MIACRFRPIRVEERARVMRLLKRHPYRGELQPVGEQDSVAVSENGGWRAILVFRAAHEASAISGSLDRLDDDDDNGAWRS